MITIEEKNQIINEAVEKALLKMPEVVGNLITNHMAKIKTNKEFYAKYPDLAKNKQMVASVVEALDGANPNMPYESLLDKAATVAREKIKTSDTLDTFNITKPNRDLSKINLGNGEL